MKFFSLSPFRTKVLAKKILKNARPKNVRLFLLEGNLGSGKTVFVQGLAKALGVRRPVKSPSFVLVSEYKGQKANLIHVDLYRLEKPQEVKGLALEEYLADPKNVMAIEWSERLPRKFWRQYPRVHISLKMARKQNHRVIRVRSER